jgi:hypothetical protein
MGASLGARTSADVLLNLPPLLAEMLECLEEPEVLLFGPTALLEIAARFCPHFSLFEVLA